MMDVDDRFCGIKFWVIIENTKRRTATVSSIWSRQMRKMCDYLLNSKREDISNSPT
jgi:hypothetical protein